MGKKTIVWAYLIILSLGTILSLYIPKNEVAAKDAIVIPGQAIRLRILANSDLEADQALKRKVRDKVNEKISVWVKDLTSISKARKVIKSKLPEIQATAEGVVEEEGSTQKVKVKFGKVQFPTKLYGQFLYPAGDYEAILITLGEGKGANWWCVLFPPLCFLDFSNGVAVQSGSFEDKPKTKHTSEESDAKAEMKVSASKSSEAEMGHDSASENESAQMESVESKHQDSKQTNIVERTAQTDLEEAKPEQEPTQENSEISKTQESVKMVSEGSEDQESAQMVSEGSEDQESAQMVSEGSEDQESTQLHSEQRETATVPKKSKNAKKHNSKFAKKNAPVYAAEDDQPIKVKFFAVELWNRFF